jgi:SAM-dependent methyltransferase
MGQSWSKGYVADLTYSHGYYHELAPGFIRYCLLAQGLDHLGGEGADGTYHYCELGYGQGVSANLHAAANPRGRFCGTDFNPDHALFAQGLAHQAGVPARWMATGFEELLDEDLPPLDAVTLHGVWSWIDASARHAVVEFLRRRLKVGGVVYLSYNIMPGWSAEKPLRDLLWLQSELGNAPGDSTADRIRGALDFAMRLRRGRAAYFEQNPRAGQMLDDMQRDDIHVVAHEYFNRSWHITYFADLARSLEPAGLQFAGSIHKSDLVGEVAQRARACGLEDLRLNTALRETTHDFILNRRFRRDLFVRGASRLLPAERDARLREVAFVLLRPANAISATVQTPYGTVNLDPATLRKIVQVLQAHTTPVTLGALVEEAGLSAMPLQAVVSIFTALVAQSQVFPVFPDDARQAAGARTWAMNRLIAERARHDDVLRYLASPVTGHGIDSQQPDRVLLASWEDGAHTPQALAAAAWAAAPQFWQAQSGSDDPGAARRHLADMAGRFFEQVLPQWRRLGIAQVGDACAQAASVTSPEAVAANASSTLEAAA